MVHFPWLRKFTRGYVCSSTLGVSFLTLEFLPIPHLRPRHHCTLSSRARGNAAAALAATARHGADTGRSMERSGDPLDLLGWDSCWDKCGSEVGIVVMWSPKSGYTFTVYIITIYTYSHIISCIVIYLITYYHISTYNIIIYHHIYLLWLKHGMHQSNEIHGDQKDNARHLFAIDRGSRQQGFTEVYWCSLYQTMVDCSIFFNILGLNSDSDLLWESMSCEDQ